jgi:hypothetical protein
MWPIIADSLDSFEETTTAGCAGLSGANASAAIRLNDFRKLDTQHLRAGSRARRVGKWPAWAAAGRVRALPHAVFGLSHTLSVVSRRVKPAGGPRGGQGAADGLSGERARLLKSPAIL